MERTAVLLLVCLGVSECASFNCSSIICKKLTGNIIEEIGVKDKPGPIPIEDYIRQFGYPVESHEIKTQDGYILTYHRIPHGKDPSRRPPLHGRSSFGPPLLLQHGLLCGSTVWVMSTNALAYVLADAGFDVWLGNARGNTYSRKHASYDPDKDKEEFFDFSWHEMGYYDLPASIDYILNATGYFKLFYIGHSMGTTMYFVLGATRPEYMDRIHSSVLLAPVSYPWHFNSIIPFLESIFFEHDSQNTYEVWPLSNTTIWLDFHICKHPSLQFLCRFVIFSFCGFDEEQLDENLLPTILEYLPAGTSHKTLQHFRQIWFKQVFSQFDYGYEYNLLRYGTPKPPEYNMSLLTSPIYIYYGANDWAATPQDVMHTVAMLPNVQGVTKVPYDKFNHIDFMWAIDAKTLLYDDIVYILQST